MPRSGAEARRRLQQAALELYQERGFDQTTAAEIAARAGVNERTFFRHFPDKREVLFDGEADLRAALTRAVVEAPEGLEPFETLLYAFRKSAQNLENNRPFSEPRWKIIAVTPALRERELAKHASLTDAVAEALRLRGAGDWLASLAYRDRRRLRADIVRLRSPNVATGPRHECTFKAAKACAKEHPLIGYLGVPSSVASLRRGVIAASASQFSRAWPGLVLCLVRTSRRQESA